MTETRDITLGGQVYAVPHLPIRINKLAYPICRKLSRSVPATNDAPAVLSLIERFIAANGTLDCTDEEMEHLAELAFLAASAADRTLKREVFDELPITPSQLLDAFFITRYQTGAWLAPEEAQAEPGEAQGA